jgi:radical SAM protein with 4Fe4S-binding SPASM domain
MILEQLIQKYQSTYDIVGIINLDHWYSLSHWEQPQWLRDELKSVYKSEYLNNQRVILMLTQGDEYKSNNDKIGIILSTVQHLLNQLDISNFFVVLVTDDNELMKSAELEMRKISNDLIPITFEYFHSNTNNTKRILTVSNIGYDYNSVRPIDVDISNLSDQQKHRLLVSKEFCIYPWVHMYVEPNGKVYPCCGTQYKSSNVLGNTVTSPLKAIWNDSPMRKLRVDMLNDTQNDSCSRCYEQEKSGFFSMRNSANKHHGRYIGLTDNTQDDGSLDDFKMIYWDVRFSNLCNLRCRSCGPSFSSSWYQDQLKIAPDYKKEHKALIFAGKYETDLWEQLLEHIDYVDQIYFAGGEPIMMDEHYRILDELVRRNKFNIRLIYNTNFTQIHLKEKTVFDYWKKFDSVSVGASLDASHQRGEYIRKGTEWEEVEQHRRLMIETCPKVDFYISSTLSILNAWHVPDFHREWVDKGLIKAKDWNINILTDPMHYRLDIAPEEYKKEIQQKYQQHLAWLSPQDSLRRASNGYESAIKFMNATDNTQLIDTFWRKTHELDDIRKENILDVIPELAALK